MDCRHSYSKAAVMDIVQQSTQQPGKKRPVKCPLPGCTATITKDKLRVGLAMPSLVQMLNDRMIKSSSGGPTRRNEDDDGGRPRRKRTKRTRYSHRRPLVAYTSRCSSDLYYMTLYALPAR